MHGDYVVLRGWDRERATGRCEGSRLIFPLAGTISAGDFFFFFFSQLFFFPFITSSELFCRTFSGGEWVNYKLLTDVPHLEMGGMGPSKSMYYFVPQDLCLQHVLCTKVLV